MKVPKSMMRKKIKEDEQTLAKLIQLIVVRKQNVS